MKQPEACTTSQSSPKSENEICTERRKQKLVCKKVKLGTNTYNLLESKL